MSNTSPPSLPLQVILLSLGKSMSALSSVLITIMLTRFLTMEDYATHKQALLIYALIGPTVTLGLPKALYFFLPGETTQQRRVLLENLCLLSLIALIVAFSLGWGGLSLFAESFNNPTLLFVQLPLIIYLVCMIFITAFTPCMMGTGHVKQVVYFQLGSRLGLLALVGGAVLIWPTVETTLTIYAIWGVVALIYTGYWMWKSTSPDLSSNLKYSPLNNDTSPLHKTQFSALSLIRSINLPDLWKHLSYGVPLGLAGLFGTLTKQADQSMVSLLCSKEDFAIYATGALEIPFIAVITGSLNTAILPKMVGHYKQNEHHAIIQLWQGAMNHALLLLIPLMVMILCVGDDVMIFLFSSAYQEAAEPFRIYALNLPLRSAIYGGVLMATGRTRWVTLSALFGFGINLILNYILISAFGSIGAAWASVLTTYGIIALMLWPMSRALQTTPGAMIAWDHFFKVLGIGIGVGGVLLLLHQGFLFLSLPLSLRLILEGIGCLGLSFLAYHWTRICTWTDLKSMVRTLRNKVDG